MLKERPHAWNRETKLVSLLNRRDVLLLVSSVLRSPMQVVRCDVGGVSGLLYAMCFMYASPVSCCAVDGARAARPMPSFSAILMMG